MKTRDPLYIPEGILVELRLALLADLRSEAERYLTVIAEHEHDRLADRGIDDEPHERRFREALHAVKVRQELQDMIGWPGRPVTAQILAYNDQHTLALAVLHEYHDAQVARLACGTVPDAERESTRARVQLLSGYLPCASTRPTEGNDRG